MKSWHSYIASKHEIIPGLFLGNEASALCSDYDLILNITHNRLTEIFHKNNRKRFPVKDPGPYSKLNKRNWLEQNTRMLNILESGILELILYNLQMNNKVLIHCHAGAQRSAIIVLAFLIKYTDLNYEYAKNYMIAKRPFVFYNGLSMNFQPALFEFAKKENIEI